jgi:hypothetical protein
MLAAADIVSVEQLRMLGSVRAFAMVKHAGVQPSLNLLAFLRDGARVVSVPVSVLNITLGIILSCL